MASYKSWEEFKNSRVSESGKDNEKKTYNSWEEFAKTSPYYKEPQKTENTVRLPKPITTEGEYSLESIKNRLRSDIDNKPIEEPTKTTVGSVRDFRALDKNDKFIARPSVKSVKKDDGMYFEAPKTNYVPYVEPNTWSKVIGKSIGAGIEQANTGLTNVPRVAYKYLKKVADTPILGDILPPAKIVKASKEISRTFGKDYDVIEKGLDDLVKHYENNAMTFTREATEGASKAQEFVGRGISSTVNMMPTIAATLMTGGGSAAATPIDYMTKSIIPGLTKGSIKTFFSQLKDMVPFMSQAAGQYAREAENEGKSLEQQILYGTYGGLTEGITEMIPFEHLKNIIGIGDDVLKQEVKKGAKETLKRFGKKGIDWLINAGLNVAEEITADPLIKAGQAGILGKSIPLAGEEGFISSKDALESAKGALGMSLVMTALGLPISSFGNMLASRYIENGTIPTTDIEVETMSKAIDETKIPQETVQQPTTDTKQATQIPDTQQPKMQKSHTSYEETLNESINRQQNIIDDLEYQKNYLGVNVEESIERETKRLNELATQIYDFIRDKEARKEQAEESYKFEQGQIPLDEIMRRSEVSTTPAQVDPAQIEPTEIKTNITEQPTGEKNDTGNMISPETIKIDSTALQEQSSLATGVPITERTVRDVGDRKIKAYQFDNPEVKPYYQDYAQYILENEFVPNAQLNRTTLIMDQLKADTGLQPAQIKDALERLIKDKGQENVAAAKRVELVIDDMLTNGFDSVLGDNIPPIQDYIDIKSKLEGKEIIPVEKPTLDDIPVIDTTVKPVERLKDTDQIGIAGANVRIVRDNDGKVTNMVSPYGQAWDNNDGTWSVQMTNDSNVATVKTEKEAMQAIDSGMERTEAKPKKEPVSEQMGIEELNKNDGMIDESSMQDEGKIPKGEQPEMYRYYLTQRPPSPGAIPKGAKNVVSFDSRQYVDDVGKEAWGYAEYPSHLSQININDYELVEHPYNNELYKKETEGYEEYYGYKKTGTDVQKSVTQSKDIENLILNKSDKLDTKPSEPVKRSDIEQFLREVLDIPIEQGKFRQRAKGIFKVQPEVIRLKKHKDMETLFHEVGHFLDKKLKLQDKYFKDELMNLGELTSLPSYSNSQIISEGVAEFVRIYTINPDMAKKEAPKFYDYFKGKVSLEKSLDEMFDTVRIAVNNYINQDAENRVLGNISIGKKNKGRKITLDRLYTTMFDELHPLEVAVKKITGGKKIDTNINPFELAWLYRGVMGKAESILKYGPVDKNFNIVGKSFEEILKPVKKDINQFRAYSVSSRVIELNKRGIETGIRIEDAKYVLSKYKDSGYDKVMEELVDFQDKVLDSLVETGMLSEKQKQQMRELNKQYVPFYRVLDNVTSGTGKGFESKQTIKGIKGSTRDIIDPLESIIKNTYLLTSMAERNRVGKAFVELTEMFEGSGKVMDKVPPKMVGQPFALNEVKKILEGAGADVENIDLDAIATIFRPSGYTSKDNVITVFRDGKPEYYEVFDTELYRAFTAMDKESTATIIKILSFPAKLLRAGATLNPEFMARNPIRDAFFASIASEYGFIPGIDTVKGLMHVLKQDDVYQKWMASGAANSSMVSVDRDYLQKDLRGMLDKSLKDKTLNIITHPLDILRALSEFSEEATRVRVFEKGLEKEGYTAEGIRKAALASRDATVDFSRFGTATKNINKLVAFFNAGLQGPDKLIRQFKNKPVQSLLKSLLYITLPSIVLWFMNKDDERYKELPQYQKDLFWIIPTKNVLYRIPKPFEPGMVFGTLVERSLDSILKEYPDAFEGYAEQLFDTITPDIIPTALLPYIEVLTNYDMFRNRPIVPVGEQGSMPAEQYSKYTSETAKLIGKTFNMSPRKVDHVLKGYGASMAQYATDILDSILAGAGIVDKKTVPEKPIQAKAPFVKGFALEPYQSSSSVDKLYKELNKLEAEYNTARKQGNLKNFHKIKRLKELRKRTDTLSELRKIMNNVYDSDFLSAKEKKGKINDINVKIVNVARGAYKLEELPNKKSE